MRRLGLLILLDGQAHSFRNRFFLCSQSWQSIAITVTRPGTTITYTHIITNSGTTSDTFALEVTSSNHWPVELLEDYSSETALPPLELSAGLSSTFVVSLSVPASTSGGVVEHTVVTATSSNNTAIQATLVDTTTVKAEITNLPLVTRNW